MAGIYFHIPFCRQRCAYCDFFSSTSTELKGQIIEAMCREVEQRQGYLAGQSIETIYFGGGTPSLLEASEIELLLDTTARHFDLSQLGECTLEANPDDLTSSYLSNLKALGINRLSMGVQSFCDDALRFMNRRHSSQQAVDAVKAAQGVGFENITIDIIYGIPTFGEHHLQQTLDTALSLEVQHISSYHLTIEAGSSFGRAAARGELQAVDEITSQREFDLVHDTLCAGGFEHYEVSNFALPQYRSKHNSSYWSGAHYLGIGAAAHSFNGKQREWNASNIKQYIESKGREIEHLTPSNRLNEYIMTRLRTAEGIDIAYIREHFGVEASEKIVKIAEKWLSSGSVVRCGSRVVIPPKGFLLSDMIIESMFGVEI